MAYPNTKPIIDPAPGPQPPVINPYNPPPYVPPGGNQYVPPRPTAGGTGGFSGYWNGGSGGGGGLAGAMPTYTPPARPWDGKAAPKPAKPMGSTPANPLAQFFDGDIPDEVTQWFTGMKWPGGWGPNPAALYKALRQNFPGMKLKPLEGMGDMVVPMPRPTPTGRTNMAGQVVPLGTMNNLMPANPDMLGGYGWRRIAAG